MSPTDMWQYVGMGSGFALAAVTKQFLWLRFCRWYIDKTGGTTGLTEVNKGRP